LKVWIAKGLNMTTLEPNKEVRLTHYGNPDFPTVVIGLADADRSRAKAACHLDKKGIRRLIKNLQEAEKALDKSKSE
jgi:hypothetical protein